ncbi:aspartate dehydrogenase [Aminivibrio sp.]|uniref:aspartate dehydrogenase n=1 Tax=Aminivibrio sp. TaxID=1872489 RepID=UPI0016A95807|nr:aspartate dehydrogenase [Synergistaceae bacterium]
MKKLRVAILGCGTIGRFVADHIADGVVPRCELVAVYLRSPKSRGREHLESRNIPWVTSLEELFGYSPDVVVEASTHDTVEAMGPEILSRGVDFVPLSLGAFVNPGLMETMVEAAEKGGSRLHIPSGGIGALDALQTALLGDVEKVTMTTRKYSTTWKGIPAVNELGVDLDNLKEPLLLFEGPARECMKKYPQSINIGAALSIAGIGFDRTMIRIYADPTVEYNTHEIRWEGSTGKVTVIFENTPVPTNPKTTYQACLSTLFVLKNMTGNRIIGA